MALVLVVDDDYAVAQMLGDAVTFCGHKPIVETDSLRAATRTEEFAAILTDLMMPRINGIELLAIFADRSPSVRRILVTAAPEEAEVREATRAGIVQHVVAKPPGLSDIKYALAWLD
jgi:two-component system response regulator FlrC